MAYLDLLVDTCTVQRNTPGAVGGYGTRADSWADVASLTDIDCRLMATTGREVKIGAEVVIADYKLFLDDVDITEQDRVVIDSITYEVLLVSTRQDWVGNHHKECLMRTVR